ncbi:hypothetical protein WJX72_001024 [[Myrmecia] bisecta]|uniref:Uncharacterized protein n=1 Tax=[Myrmecia] bisecta TaxID=41462 RepID=A0AAW1PTT3_9CHLO
MVLTNDQELFCWGSEDLNSQEADLLPGGAACLHAAAGWDHDIAGSYIALTDAGEVWTWGSNSDGQIGSGHVGGICGPTPVMAAPVEVTALGAVRCIGVSAGLGHTVVVSDSGAVYAWGWNQDGQLGLGHDYSEEQPQLVESPLLDEAHVVKVCCGARHTLALTADARTLQTLETAAVGVSI